MRDTPQATRTNQLCVLAASRNEENDVARLLVYNTLVPRLEAMNTILTPQEKRAFYMCHTCLHRPWMA